MSIKWAGALLCLAQSLLGLHTTHYADKQEFLANPEQIYIQYHIERPHDLSHEGYETLIQEMDGLIKAVDGERETTDAAAFAKSLHSTAVFVQLAHQYTHKDPSLNGQLRITTDKTSIYPNSGLYVGIVFTPQEGLPEMWSAVNEEFTAFIAMPDQEAITVLDDTLARIFTTFSGTVDHSLRSEIKKINPSSEIVGN